VLTGRSPGGDDAPQVDRHALGAIVFADPSARAALEAIVHPRMRTSFLAAIGRAQRAGAPPLVVLDAAILLEAGWDDLCDRIVFVDAPRPERLRRVAAARGWSEETLAARERAQWPADQKRRRADWILTNATGSDRLDEEVDRLVCWLRDTAPLADAAGPVRLEAPARAAAWAMPKSDPVTLTPSAPVESAI
jgi:dephospho-CoA kinase